MFSRLALLAVVVPTALTASECPISDPPPEVPVPHFPEGQYYLQSPYLYALADVPEVYTFAAWTVGGSSYSGAFTGQFLIVAWASQAAYDSGAAPYCTVYEDISATDHPADSNPDVDYVACPYCAPYSNVHTVLSTHTGCSAAFIAEWYWDETAGAWNYEGDQVWGYRDMASGWPYEFSPVVPDYEAQGYEGALYDMTPGSLASAMYFVKPQTWIRAGAPAPKLIRVEVDDPGQSRRITPPPLP